MPFWYRPVSVHRIVEQTSGRSPKTDKHGGLEIVLDHPPRNQREQPMLAKPQTGATDSLVNASAILSNRRQVELANLL
jgi:hypothetical protein